MQKCKNTYLHKYISTYTYISTYLHIYISTYLHIYIYISIYINIYRNIYIYYLSLSFSLSVRLKFDLMHLWVMGIENSRVTDDRQGQHFHHHASRITISAHHQVVGKCTVSGPQEFMGENIIYSRARNPVFFGVKLLFGVAGGESLFLRFGGSICKNCRQKGGLQRELKKLSRSEHF